MRLPEVDVAEYSGGAPPVCQSTLATRFASSARSRRGSDDRGARVPWRPGFGQEWTSFPIARLRYTATTKSWTLYWRDRDLRFHVSDRLAPSPSVDAPLAEIERDPTCIFWG